VKGLWWLSRSWDCSKGFIPRASHVPKRRRKVMHVALFVCWWRLTLTVCSIPHGTQTVPGHSRSGVAPAEGSSSLRDTIPREIVVRCQQLVTGTANLLLWSQQLIIERKRKSRSRDVNGLNFTLGNELGLPDARYRFVRTPSLCEYQRQQADVKLPSVSTRAPGEVVAPTGAGEEVPGGNEVGNWSSRPDRRPFPPWPAGA